MNLTQWPRVDCWWVASQSSSQDSFPGFILNTFSVLILKTRRNTYHSVIACIQAMILTVIELYMKMSLPRSFRSRSISIACYIESSQDWQSNSRSWVLVYVSYIKGKEKKSDWGKFFDPAIILSSFSSFPFLSISNFGGNYSNNIHCKVECKNLPHCRWILY